MLQNLESQRTNTLGILETMQFFRWSVCMCRRLICHFDVHFYQYKRWGDLHTLFPLPFFSCYHWHCWATSLLLRCPIALTSGKGILCSHRVSEFPVSSLCATLYSCQRGNLASRAPSPAGFGRDHEVHTQGWPGCEQEGPLVQPSSLHRCSQAHS